jgi:hypothetical protein
MQVGNVDVPRLRPLRRQAPRIDARAAMMEFVPASVRQRKAGVPIANAGKVGG